MPVGLVRFEDRWWRSIRSQLAALAGGRWVALPRRACLGAMQWRLSLAAGRELPITGGVWRIGADKSTTFTSAADLAFADGTEVPSGAYSIWARKSAEGGWSLVFNKQTGQWGTRHDPAQDLVAVHLNESKSADSAELVTIGLAEAGGGAVLTIQWGEMSLSTKFKAN